MLVRVWSNWNSHIFYWCECKNGHIRALFGSIYPYPMTQQFYSTVYLKQMKIDNPQKDLYKNVYNSFIHNI